MTNMLKTTENIDQETHDRSRNNASHLEYHTWVSINEYTTNRNPTTIIRPMDLLHKEC